MQGHANAFCGCRGHAVFFPEMLLLNAAGEVWLCLEMTSSTLGITALQPKAACDILRLRI